MGFTRILASQILLMLLFHAFCHEEDLECFNDYETEVKCHIPYDSHQNCSEYNLNVTHAVVEELNKYTCIFEQSHFNPSICECNFKVQEFVITENFTTTLLKGVNIIYKKTLATEDFIKPKTPSLSVQKTKNGDFNVTWDDKYESETFADSLTINLTYWIKGDNKKITRLEKNTIGFYEITGGNLQPNTDYILTARMSTQYNDHKIYSDESTEYPFTTSSSPNEILKIVLPAVCVALIFIIFTTFLLIFRVKTLWWDKISKPKLYLSHEEKNTPVFNTLSPSFMAISPIHAEIPRVDEKKLILATLIDTNNDKSCKSVDSAVDYAQTCSGNPEENLIELTQHALHELFPLLRNPTSMLPSNNQVSVISEKSLDTSSLKKCNCTNFDSGVCSGSSAFSNVPYFKSPTDDSSFPEPLKCDHFYKSEVSNSYANIKNPPVSADTSKTQCNSLIIDNMEDGYQCHIDVLDKENRKPDPTGNLTNGSTDFDEKFIMRNLSTSKNPLYPIIACDTGYQDFQNLAKDTEGQWSPTTSTEVALSECGSMKVPQTVFETVTQQSSWTPSLHISTNIQIDHSYHCV